MKTFGAVFEVIADVVKHLVMRFEMIQKQVSETMSKISEAMKAIYPQIKESVDKILDACLQVFEALSNLGLAYLKAILNVINEHQKELKELISVGSDIVQDVAKICFKAFAQLEKDIKDFITMLVQQLKAFPIYDSIKEKYQELIKYEVSCHTFDVFWKIYARCVNFFRTQIPEGVWATIKDMSENFKAILPTKELMELFDVISVYISKLLKRENVDDSSELKKIWSHAVNAFESVLALMQSFVTTDKILDVFNMKINPDFSFFRQILGLSTFRLSLINLILSNELPTPMELYYTYR